MYVNERSDLLLEAVVTGSPVPEVQWLLDEEPLEIGKGIEIGKQGNKHYAKISKVRSENEGEYKIVAMNSVAATSFASEVLVDDVKKDGEGPKILKSPCNSAVKQGETACFEIEAEGVEDLEWYYNGKLLEDTAKYDIDLDEDVDNFKFLVKKCEEKDIGTYEFVLFGKTGETTCSAKLAIKRFESIASNFSSEVKSDERMAYATAEEPKIIKTLEALDVDEGEKACFEIKAFDVDEVEWYHDGKIIESSENHSFHADKDTFKLMISNCHRKDAGKYECILLNEFSERSSVTYLTVKKKLDVPGETGEKGPESALNSEPTSKESELERSETKVEVKAEHVKSELEPPTVNEISSACLDVTEGEDIRLEVEVTGNPAPKVEWLRRFKKVIELKNKVNIEREGTKSVLVIKNATLADGDTYKCVALNKCGKTSKNFTVKVSKYE